MRVINKLAKPGDIRRVDLTPDIVRIQTTSGVDRLYRLVSVVGDNELTAEDARTIADNVEVGQK